MSAAIQTLAPDYVLPVTYQLQDVASATPTKAAQENLKKLIQELHDNGFSTQVRAGSTPSSLLVFLRLSSFKYSEIAEKDLIQNYEFGVTAKNDGASDRLRIIHSYLTSSESAGGLGIVPGKGKWGFVNSIVPVTDAFDDTSLTEHVKTHLAPAELSTNSIKEKYGVQIALYFEFSKFYTTWLVFLAVVGATSYFKSGKIFSLTYTFINLTWGVLFLAFWNRKQQYLVNFWGVQNSHLVDEYNTELAQVNKNFETKSSYKHKDNSVAYRFIKEISFVPIALFFTAVLVTYQLTCFTIEIFLTDIYDGPGKSFLTLIPTILISVFVPILTIVYNIVSGFVINWENHDNDYSRDRSILIKTFVLNFLTSYMPLIITSFVYLPFAHLVQPHLGDIRDAISANVNQNHFYYKYLIQLKKQENFKMNQQRLNAQFYYFIVTNQIIQLILKYALPLILNKVIKIVKGLLKKEPTDYVINDREDEKVWLDNVRHTIELPEYNVNDDFRALVLQYGYLIIFGPVWTLAPIVCIIFNIITFKLDTLKLANGKYFRPPTPSRVDSIHPWNSTLFLLTWISSIISPIVTVFYRHGTAPPKTLGQFAFEKASVHASSAVKLVILLFVSEHGFLILSYVLNKFNNLFKSEVEWKNDFVDNDIKLRHDYYSDKVKPSYVPEDDGEWASFTPEQSILAASKLPVTTTAKDNKSGSGSTTSGPSNSGPTPIPKTKNNAYSTSAQPSQTQVKSRSATKAPVDEESASDLTDKKALEKIKDEDDKIIKTKNSQGVPQYATIDNNKHFNAKDIEKTLPKTVDDIKDAIPKTADEIKGTIPKSADEIKGAIPKTVDEIKGAGSDTANKVKTTVADVGKKADNTTDSAHEGDTTAYTANESEEPSSPSKIALAAADASNDVLPESEESLTAGASDSVTESNDYQNFLNEANKPAEEARTSTSTSKKTALKKLFKSKK
ncbi:calcium-activated chloride channel-domain-containing protein [Scheffersomyces xylosifermentans]|uniref:calcium-activated chloride channel-domain-containing protein n=1 Tax=Scheffersomyces xylosifermentans TaxID=1304137 RepID=UPI00315DDDC8